MIALTAGDSETMMPLSSFAKVERWPEGGGSLWNGPTDIHAFDLIDPTLPFVYIWHQIEPMYPPVWHKLSLPLSFATLDQPRPCWIQSMELHAAFETKTVLEHRDEFRHRHGWCNFVQLDRLPNADIPREMLTLGKVGQQQIARGFGIRLYLGHMDWAYATAYDAEAFDRLCDRAAHLVRTMGFPDVPT